jgi:hypothetical protein
MWLSGYKTYIVAGLLLAHAVTGYVTGEMPQGDAVTLILEALGLGGLRAGVSGVRR